MRPSPCLLVLILALLAATACGGPSEQEVAPAPQILLVGMDGLEWRVLLPLVQTGDLPVFSRLMRDGSYGKLATLKPTSSPVIWTSVATGKSPAKHGIADLQLRNKQGKAIRSYLSTDRRAKAVWNIFSDAGLTAHAIGWWKSYPVEKISGTMVSQLNVLYSFTEDGRGLYRGGKKFSMADLVHPESYRPSVMRIALDTNTDRAIQQTWLDLFGGFRHPHSQLGERLVQRVIWVVALDTMHIRVALEILQAGERFDLMLTYLRGADVLGHHFWRFTYPESFGLAPTSEEIQNYSGLIPDYYRHLDAALGSLLEAAGPDTAVIVVSDHGMGPRQEEEAQERAYAQILSGAHDDAPPGVLIAAGPRIRRPDGTGLRLQEMTTDQLTLLGSVYDVVPTILAVRGLAIGEDMDGSIMRAVVDPEYLKRNPPAYIKSHEGGPGLEEPRQLLLSEEEERDRLEELRSLGYIE